MTTAHDIDWPQVLADRLTSTSPDVLRELLGTFIHALMGAEADALCGGGMANAAPSVRISATGIGDANSTRGQEHWIWRSPSAARLVFPGLAAGAPQAGGAGPDHGGRDVLSARGVDAPDGQARRDPGITSLSKSQVSVDTAVEAFRSRPLDGGPYTFVAADALVLKVREAGAGWSTSRKATSHASSCRRSSSARLAGLGIELAPRDYQSARLGNAGDYSFLRVLQQFWRLSAWLRTCRIPLNRGHSR
jgi:putative transposase